MRSFSVIKALSAAIRQQHILGGHKSPTEGIFSSTVLRAAKRKNGTKVKNVKEPWTRLHMEAFVVDMCNGIASVPMYVTRLSAFCIFASFGKFSCLSPLKWQNFKFDIAGQVVIEFEQRKQDQFREGSEVVIPSNPSKPSACIVSLLTHWRELSPAPEA